VRGVLSRESSGWRRLFRWESLRTRLIFWNMLTLALLLAVLGLVTRAIVLRSMMASVDRELDVRTRPMGPAGHPPPRNGPGRPDGPPGDNVPGDPRPPELQGGPPGRPDDPPQGPDPRPGAGPPRNQRADPRNPYRPVHFDSQGHLLDVSSFTQPLDPEGFQEALQGRIHRGIVTVDGEPMRVLSRPIPAEGPPNGVVQAPYPLTEMYLAIDSLDSALLLLAPIGLIGTGLVGAFLTDQVLRRVRRLTQAAGRIGAQELSERLPATGNDEFSELAQTFNSLLGRMQSAFQKQERLIEQQRRFTADASHELKTPLTIVKGNSGLLLDSSRTDEASKPALQEIDHAADTMSRLVQDLLLLARSDDGQLGSHPIELLVTELVQRATTRLGSRPAAVICRNIPASLTVRGNEQELLRLFTNLLGNAVNYTPVEGQILVTAEQEGENVRVTIADTGIGIAPEHLPHLGERFYRVDAARTRSEGGTGLGLSICRSIVQAHHGDLTIQSKIGVGTSVTVLLPN
jgi:signal transduction histidine kinase